MIQTTNQLSRWGSHFLMFIDVDIQRKAKHLQIMMVIFGFVLTWIIYVCRFVNPMNTIDISTINHT